MKGPAGGLAALLEGTDLPKPAVGLPSEIAAMPPAALVPGCSSMGSRVGVTAAPRRHRWGQPMAKASPQHAEGTRTPGKRCLRGGQHPCGPGSAVLPGAVGDERPSTLRLRESKRRALGWLQAFRHGQDVHVPARKKWGAAPMAALAKSPLAHNQGLVPLVRLGSFTPWLRCPRRMRLGAWAGGGGVGCLQSSAGRGAAWGAALPWEQAWSCAGLRTSL